MDFDEDYYKTICRVCLCCCENKNMVSLVVTGEKDVLTCYGIAVKTFANIEIKLDSLPYMMCQDCLLLLKQAIKFKKTCENSDETLKRLVQNIGDSCVQTKEIVTQYVMFSNYFADTCVEKCTESIKANKKLCKSMDYTGNSTDNVEALDVTVIIERMLDTTENDVGFQDYYSSVDNCDDFEGKKLSSIIDHPKKYADNLLDSIEKMLQLDPAFINSKIKKYPKRISQLNLKQLPMLVKKKNKKSENKKRQKLTMPNKRVQCEVCNKVLANWCTYQTHMQRHTGKRFVCELCGKAFAINAFLRAHQAAIHNCGKFYECKLCGYKAVRNWDLEEHQRVHTGERPYTCDKCGMTFRRQYIWKKHALYHKEKTVQCPKCPCKFHQIGEMRAHYNNIHERLYVYECHECGVTYAKTATVRRHLLDKHGITKEKQGKIKRIILGRMNVE